ncbi:DUF6082 family protein [Sphaerisporangium sp. NPDC005289]|uniref:DUF6082 family protein n=1 Tax=Sphaerisporangium sp. NPDC005289 TaxID=3155247 RepID=UPI0033A1B81E
MSVRKAVQAFSVPVLCVVGLLLVVASPVLIDDLTAIGSMQELDWERLSAIGETYGTIAALFSALAFVALTISLVIQAGEARINRIQVVRGYHMKLLTMAADDTSLYMTMVGPSKVITPEEAKRRIYAALQMNYYRMAFESRIVHEESLRGECLAPSFRREFMREWWRAGRDSWRLGTRGTRRERKFFRIVEDEYAKAVAEALQMNLRSSSGGYPVGRRRQSSTSRYVVLMIALGSTLYAAKKAGKLLIRKTGDGPL